MHCCSFSTQRNTSVRKITLRWHRSAWNTMSFSSSNSNSWKLESMLSPPSKRIIFEKNACSCGSMGRGSFGRPRLSSQRSGLASYAISTAYSCCLLPHQSKSSCVLNERHLNNTLTVSSKQLNKTRVKEKNSQSSQRLLLNEARVKV
jgi:hypothetical protein